MVSTAPPSYSHATEPRAVENRKKFREPTGYGNANIMYDRRVVRGSTYSQPIDTPVRRTSPPPPPRAPRILAGRCTAHAVGSPQFLGACGRRLLVPPYLRLPLFSGSLPPAGATTWASACRTCAHFGAADKCPAGYGTAGSDARIGEDKADDAGGTACRDGRRWPRANARCC
jgi:hypothetical protein